MPHFSAVYGSSLKTELARLKSEDKAVSLHRYSSFYFVFDILEREKSFQIGPVMIPKDILDNIKPDATRKYENDGIAKLSSLLQRLDLLNTTPTESLSPLGEKLKPIGVELASFMKVQDHSYQSLLSEGIGSIRKSHDFDKSGHRIQPGDSISP